MRAEKHKKKRKRTLIRILSSFLILMLTIGGGYSYYVYHSFAKTVNKMHQPMERKKSEKRTKVVTLEKKDPFSILMLGVDERKGDSGRSDTMIVLTVNPNLKTVKMLSIPRDTRTMIIGKGFEDKINHAYAYGGVDMSVKTVENFLDIPIDYYMKINMEGFSDIIDAIGGITVSNDLDFSYDGSHFPKGEITLTGKEAIKFTRMRHQDPRGDFGRQMRQRQIIQAIIKKGTDTSFTSYDNIFKVLGNYAKTNLTYDELIKLKEEYKGTGKKVEQLALKGQGTKINGVYYYMVSDNIRQNMQTILRTHLELDK